MGLTAYAQEEKAKREAWYEIWELRKRIAELEADNKRLKTKVFASFNKPLKEQE